MGPLLFNIHVNDLFFISLSSKANAYADDTQIFSIGNDSSMIHQPMQSDLLTVCKWFNSNGLAVNHDKFLTMWLGNTMDVPTYDLGSSVISLVHSMKLLGVTIDKDLNFTEHIRNLSILTPRPNYTMPTYCHIYITAVSCGTIVVSVT